MASPDIIDVASLLTAVSDDAPTGIDIREDYSASSPYQVIKSLRASARTAERQSIHDGNSSQADEFWRDIISQAPIILRDSAKDLEVACWFAEAMLRRHGFAGLKNAFQIIEGLLEHFWENLYPMPDEYGIETRVACLSGLNGEGAEGALLAPIRKVELTAGDSPGPYSLWQYKQAIEAQRAPDEETRQKKISNLGFGMEDVQESVNQSSDDFIINLRDDLEICIESYKKIGALLDEYCGIHEAPPTRNIVEVMEECLSAVKHIGSHKFPVDAPEENDTEEENTEDGESGATAAAKPQNKGPVANREDAFKQLLIIADFFKKTEPHSPVSYVLQKAVKWGNMPLDELIGELIPDDSSREKYSELTGVKPNDDG